VRLCGTCCTCDF